MADRDSSETFTHTRDVMEGRASLDPERMKAELAILEHEHGHRIRSLCRRYTRNVETAEDLAQDALLEAWRQLPKFRGDSSLSTWVLGIAKHKVLNHLRKRRDSLAEDGVIDDVDPKRDVLKALSQAERNQVMRQAAAAVLDDQEQEVVHLRYIEGLGREEIADELGLEGGAEAVRVILFRCTRRLKPELVRRLAEIHHGLSFVTTTDS
jgi:RNA polymerase sigma-70 factor (ECF subfamily)